MSILILPVGSYEQHGPVLPPETDIRLAEYMAKELAKKFEDSSVLPVIPFGMAAEHNGFPNTISISMQSAMSYWTDVLKSITDNMPEVELVVVINGHGGNQTMLETICSQMNYTTSGARFVVLHVFQPESRKLATKLFGAFSAHADSVESSVYAAITPEFSLKNGESFETDIVKRHSLKLYPTCKITQNGIISKLPSVVIDTVSGKKVIELSLDEMYSKVQELLDVIREF